MVTRAFATLGTGDEVEPAAMAAMAALDALVDDGEPIVSAYRAQQDGPWIIDVLFMDWDEPRRAHFMTAAAQLVPALATHQWDALADRDWVAESQKALHPVRAGRFVVHGAHDRDALPPSRWRLQIDAGRAFGTAHHASTQGCLIALERLAKRQPLGMVADVGTGTGVLALAADRLGATRVVASDVDAIAVRVAAANIAANARRAPIRTQVASGPVAKADTVVANILARPLIAMAGPLAASAQTLILSGLRRRDARRVLAAYRAHGLTRESAIVIEDWITLTLSRPKHGRRGPKAEAPW